MKLNDIIPQKVEFKFAKVGVKYTLNPISLEDEAWMSSKWTQEELEKVFEQGKMDEVLQIVYRLLDYDSKKHLLTKVELKDLDEDGNEIVVSNLTGPQKLKYLVAGIGEVTMLYDALMKCKGISQPMIELLEKATSKKKSKKSTGQPYSTL